MSLNGYVRCKLQENDFTQLTPVRKYELQKFLDGLQGWQSVTTVELSPSDSRWALKIIGPKLMVRRNVHLGRVHCQPWCTQSFIYSLRFKWALSCSTVVARLVVSKGYYRPAHKTWTRTLMGPQTSPWQQGRVGCWQLQESKCLKRHEQNIIGSPIYVEAQQRLRKHGGVQGCSRNSAKQNETTSFKCISGS